MNKKETKNRLQDKDLQGNKFVFNLIYLKCILFFLLLGPLSILYSQEKNIIKGTMIWLQYYNQIVINDKWQWNTDAGYRWDSFFQERKQLISRTGVGYKLKPSVSIAAGIAYLEFYSSQNKDMREFRPYQEIKIENRFKVIKVNHRYRIEQRFYKFPDSESDQTQPGFNFRFRYSIMASIPLIKLSVEHPERKVLLSVGNEIFLNAGSEIIDNIFNQNRLLISPGIQFNKNLAVHLTWNSLFAAAGKRGSYMYNNLFWLQVKHVLDLRHSKTKILDIN